ncbi:LacI family DNA-binding transcriptional regulator [Bacillus litorisediminis]|uniref:LacI family DNA-binding transcriptional regulator n=1 Tax=Bacillus litorisediminis TaxID=2922713 RepID=UPI001FAC327E|nr:LacI family DNA-binding transcriptional regulator [Bacillus litorisediminis]
MKGKTIKDVASYAGVSISTVSRVLNGYQNVNPEVKALVLEAVEAVGYTPNALARGLRSQSTKTIGLIVNNILNPIYSVLSHAIENTARKYGYHVFLCNSGANPEYELEYLESLYEKKVDGIIIAPTGRNKEKMEAFVNYGIPIVQVDRRIEGIETDSILTNNEQGAYDLVTHMLNQGYSSIGLIVGIQSVTTGMDRMTGYYNALSDKGLTPQTEHIKVGHFDEETGYKAMNELLDLPNPPRAIFAGNNLMAMGGIKAIHERGLRIPDDIAFGMFDDPDWAQLHNPAITAVRQHTQQIGVEAAEQLIYRLKHPEDRSGPRHRVIDSELVIRNST